MEFTQTKIACFTASCVAATVNSLQANGSLPHSMRAAVRSAVHCRDAVTRVWEWLDVSVSREASLTLGGADFGHMHLSEGSSATTAVTAAPPCDTVEPCVSSLPDGQACHILVICPRTTMGR